MNKFLKIILLFSLLLFSYKVNASDTYTFSCDYKITSSEDKQISVRVRVHQLPTDYTLGNNSLDYNSKVYTYVMQDDGNYHIIKNTCQNDGYTNAPSNNSKLCILTEGDNRSGSDKDYFLREAFASGSPKCPNLYQRKDYKKGISLTVSSALAGKEYSKAASTISLNCYQDDLTSSYNCNEVKPHKENSNDFGNGGDYESNPAGDFGSEASSCYDILGKNLTEVISTLITFLQVVAAIIAIVNASIAIASAVVSPNNIGQAKKKCINMAIILVVIGVFKSIVIVIGKIFGFDLSCFQ